MGENILRPYISSVLTIVYNDRNCLLGIIELEIGVTYTSNFSKFFRNNYFVFLFATDIGFIDFHFTAEQRRGIVRPGRSDPMIQKPGGALPDANVVAELGAGNTFERSR